MGALERQETLQLDHLAKRRQAGNLLLNSFAALTDLLVQSAGEEGIAHSGLEQHMCRHVGALDQLVGPVTSVFRIWSRCAIRRQSKFLEVSTLSRFRN